MHNTAYYQNQRLHLENVALDDIADHFGTPCFVYSKDALKQNFLAYQNALGDQSHLICYAVKSNSNLAVLQTLANIGAGFDIVSVGELERVLLAGGDPSKIVFSGVAKNAAEMRRALEVGIHCFNVESEAELDLLKENKFGIDINLAPQIYQRAVGMDNISVVGVDCHIGSQITEIRPFIDAMDRLLTLVDHLQTLDIHLQHIDIGGGLGVPYENESTPSVADYMSELLPRIAGRSETLVMEPGRSITANAGVLLMKVEFIKSNGEKNFAIVDAAMNDMLRPALYEAWMDIQPTSTHSSAPAALYDIVGPVCETGDFLGKDRSLAISQGDNLCLFSAGSYGFVMSSNYNSRPRVPEVMVDNNLTYLVRARETIADLVRGEQLLPETGQDQ